MVRKLYATTPSASLLNAGAGSTSPMMNLAAVPTDMPPLVSASSPALPKATAPVQQVLQNPLHTVASAATSVAHSVASAASKITSTIAANATALAFNISKLPLEKLIKNNSHREYFINIRAPKYRYGGAYSIHVFLGEFSEDPKLRVTDKNIDGSVFVFANNAEETGCENCGCSRQYMIRNVANMRRNR
jgi:hypothetical protein